MSNRRERSTWSGNTGESRILNIIIGQVRSGRRPGRSEGWNTSSVHALRALLDAFGRRSIPFGTTFGRLSHAWPTGGGERGTNSRSRWPRVLGSTVASRIVPGGRPGYASAATAPPVSGRPGGPSVSVTRSRRDRRTRPRSDRGQAPVLVVFLHHPIGDRSRPRGERGSASVRHFAAAPRPLALESNSPTAAPRRVFGRRWLDSREGVGRPSSDRSQSQVRWRRKDLRVGKKT
jgi:hypothetical protein